jgi:hypothetical protein
MGSVDTIANKAAPSLGGVGNVTHVVLELVLVDDDGAFASALWLCDIAEKWVVVATVLARG